MTMVRKRLNRRRGIACIELAVLLLPMLILLVCTWEVARLIEAKQTLVNAAREGIRLAVSGRSFDASGTSLQQTDKFTASAGGAYIESPAGSGNFVEDPTPPGTHTLTSPDAVKQTVRNYIARSGLDTSTMKNNDITFTNLTQPSNASAWQSNPSSGTAAGQFDHMKVTVSFPADKVRWVFLPNIINLGAMLTAEAEWSSVQDIPVTVDLSVGVN